MTEVRELAPVVGEVNSLPPRTAMGMPSSWTQQSCDRLEEEVDGLRTASLEDLLETVESAHAPVRQRFAAGTLLALVGDPRVDPLDPAMVDVPGGEAWIGTSQEEVDRIAEGFRDQGVRPAWILKECPDHPVVLDDFRIGRHPVTNLEYRRYLLEDDEGEIPTSWYLGRYPAEKANHPVFSLSPSAADRYCRWLAGRTGRAFRLPSEAEWEYAAAGPGRLAFPWGEEYRPGTCNCVEEQILTTTPVGMFPLGTSWCGATDLAGNVEEYVADAYRPYPGGEVIEDDLYRVVGPDYRIGRGGAFNRFHDLARTRRRHGGPLMLDFYPMGFRLAETP